jgi:hypothetical protein
MIFGPHELTLRKAYEPFLESGLNVLVEGRWSKKTIAVTNL